MEGHQHNESDALPCMHRSEEKQVEIEELRAEVRRGEQRLRTANRDMKSMQVRGRLECLLELLTMATDRPLFFWT